MSKQVTLERNVESLDWRPGEHPLPASLVTPAESIRRYAQPAANSLFPLEYAFHLLSGLPGKTVVDLGCGVGLNTAILAALGARVLSIDASEANLVQTARRARANGVSRQVELVRWETGPLPVADASADHVLCSGICGQANPVTAARQIRRILKPGGTAIFEAPSIRSPLLEAIHKCREEYAPSRPGALTTAEIDAISRAVGFAGRRREFCLIPRLLPRETILEAALARYLRFTHRFASLVVWEARKES